MKSVPVKPIGTKPLGEYPPALLLNADYRPISEYPLSLLNWQEAQKLICLDKASVIANYDNVFIHTPRQAIALPSVIVLNEYASERPAPGFTKFNIFLRDSFTCQYCGDQDELTFDHVLPRCKGGRTTWDNIVTCCAECNFKKSDKTLEQIGYHLPHKPRQPSYDELQARGRAYPPHYLHKTWIDYLYWDVELITDNPHLLGYTAKPISSPSLELPPLPDDILNWVETVTPARSTRWQSWKRRELVAA